MKEPKLEDFGLDFRDFNKLDSQKERFLKDKHEFLRKTKEDDEEIFEENEEIIESEDEESQSDEQEDIYNEEDIAEDKASINRKNKMVCFSNILNEFKNK